MFWIPISGNCHLSKPNPFGRIIQRVLARRSSTGKHDDFATEPTSHLDCCCNRKNSLVAHKYYSGEDNGSVSDAVDMENHSLIRDYRRNENRNLTHRENRNAIHSLSRRHSLNHNVNHSYHSYHSYHS